MFSSQKSNCSRRFLLFGDRTWKLAHVFYEPLPSRWRGFFFPRSFFCISLDPSILFLKPGRSKISGDKKNPQYCQRGGVIEYACQISWSISKKRREQWMLNRFGMICLDQPVYTCSFFHLGPSFFGRLSAWRTLLWPLYLLIGKLWNHAFFGEVLA